MNNIDNVMNSVMNNQATPNQQAQMSEKELLNDLLNQEKMLFNTYSYGIIESACVQLRDILMNGIEGVGQDQFNIFDQMSKRGYYPTKAATQQEVQQVKDTASQCKTQMH